MFLQAKSSRNKMGICDNLPLSIDQIELLKNGIRLYLTSADGIRMLVAYDNLKDLYEEWDVIDCYKKIKSFKQYNYKEECL